ncbi:MAG: efflux RND transporter periplasmic adaptor subunit [Acidobacteriota bacterium]
MQDKTRAATRAPGSRRGPYLIPLILTLAILGAWVATGHETMPPTAAPERLLRVETRVAALHEAYAVERAFVGRVEAARTSDLGFELAGLVDRMLVEEGDWVEAGERLALLDQERLRSQRAELAAGLEEARAGLKLARATHQRVAEAAELDAVSDQEHDEARLELQVREAAVRQIEAQIRSLDVEITKSTLRAPYEGTVASRLVDEGEVVPAGQPVLRLLESQRLEARVGIAAGQAATLTPGDAIRVTVHGQSYPTRVKAVLPDRERRTRTVTVLLDFADLTAVGAEVRSGDLAEVLLVQRIEEPGFWLPAAALTESVRGLWACYVAEPDQQDSELHRIARREVEVLHTETARVYVRGTLQPGERVVSGGVHRLVPGQRVQVAKAEEAS